ncbi:MAG: orotidine-5'-phosphate decarboxylase [Prochloraceae cyanobacterium]|nr:orotidine-5'-phosphate decarboxylase [Prochloraceae cyanobacterium]
MKDPAAKIIVPLDVASETAAIALIDRLPQVSFWKVGLQLFVSCGDRILEVLREKEKKIFLDLKFHDIPNTMVGAIESAIDKGVDLITIHATAGKKALEKAAEVSKKNNSQTKLLAVTLLTSINSRELAFDLKIPLELPEYVLQLAILAKDAGIDGAVCSPLEAEQLRRVCGDDFLLVCPGVRPNWSETADQKRVMTPTQAIAAGADYLVIGRPIIAAEDPVLAWERICQELAEKV